MPDDFNFSIQFGFGKNNEINTFEGTLTKDLIADGKAETDFTFTSKEMREIYEMMREVNVLESKRLKPNSIVNGCYQEPHEEDRWTIDINGKTIRLDVSGAYCEPTDDAKELFDLRNEIFMIVKGKEEYKALPDPVGGYD